MRFRQIDKRSNFVIAALVGCVAMTASNGALAIQDFSPKVVATPQGLPNVPGRTEIAELNRALRERVLAERDDSMWPITVNLRMSGPDDPFQEDRVANTRMFDVSGSLTHPTGTSTNFQRAFSANGGSATFTLSPESWLTIRAGERQGTINLAAGAYVGGAARVAPTTSIPSGSATTLALGDGYQLNLSVRLRDPTPEERARNASIAQAVAADNRNRAQPKVLPKGDLPPAAEQSPLTNSIIREGDPKVK